MVFRWQLTYNLFLVDHHTKHLFQRLQTQIIPHVDDLRFTHELQQTQKDFLPGILYDVLCLIVGPSYN